MVLRRARAARGHRHHCWWATPTGSPTAWVLALASVALQGRERESRVVRVISDHAWLPWALAAFLWWLDATQLGMCRSLPPVYNDGHWLAEHLIFPAVGFLLALPAAFGDERRGLPRRILGNRLLAWFGLVSYGVFLWHQPLMPTILDAGRLRHHPGDAVRERCSSPSAPCPRPIAAASYYIVERPILRFKDRRRPPPAPAADAQPSTAVPASAG